MPTPASFGIFDLILKTFLLMAALASFVVGLIIALVFSVFGLVLPFIASENLGFLTEGFLFITALAQIVCHILVIKRYLWPSRHQYFDLTFKNMIWGGGSLLVNLIICNSCLR